MLRVLRLNEFEKYYDYNILDMIHTPFQTYYWARFHVNYFKDEFYFLFVEENDNLLAGLFLFKTITPYGSLFYTYGRYGTSGLLLRHRSDCNEVGGLIKLFKDNIIKDIEPQPLSISIGNLQTSYKSEEEIKAFKTFCDANECKYYSRFNHITDIDSLIDANKCLSFRSYNRRSIITRNLRKARDNELSISDQVSKDTIEKWHKVHLKRVTDLNGKPWPLNFFVNVIKTEVANHLKFFGAYQGDRLVGGAICFYNSHVLDIFMMSTLREFQEMGANHLLTEQIYVWCAKNDISYINWQGSNPPEGGVAIFKELWMAKRYVMHSVNLICNEEGFKKLNKKQLTEEYPDRFFYPFDC